MAESLVQSIVDVCAGNVPQQLIVFIVSMIPVLELRGSILAAGFLKMEFLPAYTLAVFGNMLPVPFILLFMEKIFAWMKRNRLKNVAVWFENRAMKRSGQIKKYGRVGLFLFVALPLPGTGAWTGSLIAALLRMRPKDALPWIFLGVLTAGLAVSLLAFGIIKQVV